MKLTLLWIPALLVVAQTAFAGQWIEGRVTHVRDIDTIEVNDLPVRLQGLDGPELNERGGREGKRWMTRLILRKPVKCWLTGEKTHDRWVGQCFDAAENDIAALAVGAGLARDCPKFSGGRYRQFETEESRRLPIKSYCR